MKLAVTYSMAWKKEGKDNALFRKYEFNNSILDLRHICSAYSLEYKEECFEKLQKEISSGRYINEDEPIFIPNEPDRIDEYLSRYQYAYLDKNNICVSMVYAPALLQETKRTDLDFLIHRLTAKSMHVASKVGASYVVVEPLVKQILETDDMERNEEFYKSFVELAKELNVKILIKNCFTLLNGHAARSALSDKYSLAKLVDDLNLYAGSDIFGIYFDIGVCNILGQDIYDICKYLSHRIWGVRICENDAVNESTLFPFPVIRNVTTKIDWLTVFRGIRAARFDGLVVYDFNDTLHSNSQILWDGIIYMARQAADFIVWQLDMENSLRKYDTRVLFGAGNMCRNYMKCYGEEFPPLFTCDNNPSIWGQYFEGLEIKNPEKLKDLPENCAIFICNTYYKEIEKQLKDMGITNPIELFNDEFLPIMVEGRFDGENRKMLK